MNKRQYIELFNLRGYTEVPKGKSIASLLKDTGGNPTDKEMIAVNYASMVHYMNKTVELKSEISRLENIIESDQEDLNFLRALEAAGVDNWEGYDIAQDYLEE